MDSLQNNGSSLPARVVRVNWLKYIFYLWKRISTLSRVIFTLYVILMAAQIATGIVMLFTSKYESCDEPLSAYVLISVVRIAVSSPFYIKEYFQKAGHRLLVKKRRALDRRREEQVRLRRIQRRQARASGSGSMAATSTAEPVASSNISVVVQPESSFLTGWGTRLKSLVDLFEILWFIVGNYMLFTSGTCSREAPRLFYTSLAFVLVGYFILIIPLVVCVSVIFCLPCVLTLMGQLNMNEVEGIDKNERAQEIERIPVLRFTIGHGQPAADNGITIQTPLHKKSFFCKFLHYRNHKARGDLEEGHAFQEIQIHPAEDAVCCICLSEYEDKDLICKLWCNHHFHQSCLKEWLTLNRKCPLCKQDFRGKEYDQDSVDENQEYEMEGQSFTRRVDDIPN